jgi:hypothetical protein
MANLESRAERGQEAGDSRDDLGLLELRRQEASGLQDREERGDTCVAAD